MSSNKRIKSARCACPKSRPHLHAYVQKIHARPAYRRALGATFFDADDYYWLPTEPPFQNKRDDATRLSLFAWTKSGAPRAVA